MRNGLFLRALGLPALLLVLCSACDDGAIEPAAGRPTADINACSLISQATLESIIGMAVEPGRLVEQREGPGKISRCSYARVGQRDDDVVIISTGRWPPGSEWGAFYLQSLLQPYAGTPIPVTGLSDEAMFVGPVAMPLLYVRKSGTNLWISLRSRPKTIDSHRQTAMALARAALAAL